MRKIKISYLFALFIAIGLLISCQESNIGTGNSSEQLTAGDVNALAAKQAQGDSPQKVFSDFQAMIDKVRKMNKVEIDNLNDEEVLKLGEPILKATESTLKMSDATLQKIKEPIKVLTESIDTMPEEEYKSLINEIIQLTKTEGAYELHRFNAEGVRNLLEKYNEAGVSSLQTTCYDIFDGGGGAVFLRVGDNFNLANTLCDAGSIFVIDSGTHTGQYVENSKNGNFWIGASGNPVMDGQFSVNSAFKDGMKNNRIENFTIKRYKEFGIFSTTSNNENIEITDMTFTQIGQNKNGQHYGAVFIDYVEDLIIADSYFHNVSAGMRIRWSDGPIIVEDNEALNTGWGFFQCGNCSGGGIRIRDNSMERTAQYGSVDLRDWISIFKSYGTNNDYIIVNHNRARGHGSSAYGSFIQLGDGGGQYQKAENNIGVSPGQVGIGAEYGYDIIVNNNKMYSDQWTNANVAFSSRNRTYWDGPWEPCGDHSFTNNTANWRGASAHEAWAPPDPQYPDSARCGIDFTQIRNETTHDPDMDEDVWNEW